MNQTGVLLAAALVFAGCASAEPDAADDEQVAVPVAASAEGVAVTSASFDSVMRDVEERQKVFDDPSSPILLNGAFVQGGLIRAQTMPGAKATLDGQPIPMSADGKFLVGFGRDHGKSALLVVTLDDGSVVRRALDVAPRQFRIERVDGLDQSKVSGFTPEQLAKIAADKEKKGAARAVRSGDPMWATEFDWPVTGRISGVFGSQRILNGQPQNMHGGVDVAAPAGTPIKAPAPGVIRLADPDMYFEGGLVFIDHGTGLESAFMHMSRIDVKPGERVEKGQVIGTVGATGRATGPHMHWSLKWTETLVDPQLVVGEMPGATAAAAGN